ncbi:MAG: hypothetical protein WC782_14125 [Methylococcaceae bacterium]|jgi:hypothetical protein
MPPKWVFTVAKNEDDYFTMLFFGKIPKGITMMMVLKAISCIGAVAAIAIVKNYIN